MNTINIQHNTSTYLIHSIQSFPFINLTKARTINVAEQHEFIIFSNFSSSDYNSISYTSEKFSLVNVIEKGKKYRRTKS